MVGLLEALEQLVGPGRVVADAPGMEAYRSDWMPGKNGLPDAVVFPQNAEQVAALVTLAAERGLAVVPRGAGTGLAGGARPLRGGLVVSSSGMQELEQLDTANRWALVQPGMITYDLSEQVAPQGFFYAPDPASWKICTIGGNIANNSGGPRCLKYGVTTNHVLALDVVLHDGSTLRTGDGVQDAAGYDLTGLFVGSEGTFGLITRALLRLTRMPEDNRVALALFPDVVSTGRAVSAIIAAGHIPTALEVMDATTILAVNTAFGFGLPREAGAALIVEVDGVREGLDQIMDSITALCAAQGALSITAAATPEEQERLWSARRSAFQAFPALAPAFYLVDTVVPRTRLPAMLAFVAELSAEYGLPIANVFHAGDGNLHPLVLYDPADPVQVAQAKEITGRILARSIAEGGAVSGEHGIGVEKQEFMAQLFAPADLAAMATVYAVFNPQHRLNPAKVFPADTDPLLLAAKRQQRLAAGRKATSLRALRAVLEAAIGTPAVLSGDDVEPYTVQGQRPALVARPGSVADLAAVLAACHAAGAVVVPWGGGTAQGQGRLGKPPDVVVSTERLRSVRRYEPDDLTVGVEAGMTLAALQELLAAHGQMLPLDAPLPARATIGGLIATATDGPRRLGYGLLRDMLLGLTVVEVDGTVVQYGGQVVKNVSGYDMSRLLIGSHGTLGVIAEARLRVFPRPPASATLLATFASREQALLLARELAATQLTPTAAEYLDGGALRRLGTLGGYGLAVRAEGVVAACERHMADLAAMAARHGAIEACSIGGDDEAALWAGIADLSAGLVAAGESLLRLAVAPAEAAAALAHLDACLAAHGAAVAVSGRVLSGVFYARVAGDVAAIQERLAGRWRHSHLLAGDQRGLAVWGEPGVGHELMQAIRVAFDPFGTLNPGRLVP